MLAAAYKVASDPAGCPSALWSFFLGGRVDESRGQSQTILVRG